MRALRDWIVTNVYTTREKTRRKEALAHNKKWNWKRRRGKWKSHSWNSPLVIALISQCIFIVIESIIMQHFTSLAYFMRNLLAAACFFDVAKKSTQQKLKTQRVSCKRNFLSVWIKVTSFLNLFVKWHSEESITIYVILFRCLTQTHCDIDFWCCVGPIWTQKLYPSICTL